MNALLLTLAAQATPTLPPAEHQPTAALTLDIAPALGLPSFPWTGTLTGTGVLLGNALGIPIAYALFLRDCDPRIGCSFPQPGTPLLAMATYGVLVLAGGTAGGALGGAIEGDALLGAIGGASGAVFADVAAIATASPASLLAGDPAKGREFFLAVAGTAAAAGVLGSAVIAHFIDNPHRPVEATVPGPPYSGDHLR